MKNLIVLFLIVSIAIIGCQSRTSKELQEREVAIDRIFADYNDVNKPGAAVAVVKDGAVVFTKGYGSANLEYDIPVTPSSIFHIASVSKQFTVFAVLLLADEGKLSFDDDIRKHIPEVPDFGKTITLRHLASHTSGLRDQWELLSMAGWRPDDVITREHVLKVVGKQMELNFAPGEEYLYCNTGFTLLADVVQRVSGQSFAEFTKSRIFDPLGMSNTLFYDDHEKIVRNRAYSYYEDENSYKKRVLSYANVGATSLFTTVEDLALWALNFESPIVGTSEVFDQMNTLATLNNGETFGGAYGQFVNEYKGLRQIQHGGADAGYRTYFGRFPDQDFAVMVFCNLASSNPGALALSVADQYLGAQMSEPNESRTVQPEFITLTGEELEGFAGSYWNEAESYSREIYVENDTLRYSRGEHNVSPLLPISENTFQMLDVGVDLKVSFDIDGERKLMAVTVDNEDPVVSESYIPESYSSKEFSEFTGTYYSGELSTSYNLVVKNNALVATHSRHEDIVITPLKADRFTGDSWYFGDIKFERDDSNFISGMLVSSGRVRNLYFEKKLAP